MMDGLGYMSCIWVARSLEIPEDFTWAGPVDHDDSLPGMLPPLWLCRQASSAHHLVEGFQGDKP